MNDYVCTGSKVLGHKNRSGKKLNGPFFLVVSGHEAGYFYRIENGSVLSPYSNFRLVYTGRFLALLYFDSDTVFPVFSY